MTVSTFTFLIRNRVIYVSVLVSNRRVRFELLNGNERHPVLVAGFSNQPVLNRTRGDLMEMEIRLGKSNSIQVTQKYPDSNEIFI